MSEASPSETTRSPELTRFNVTEYVEMTMPGAMLSESSSEPLNGRTIEQIAQEAPRGVFALKTYKQAEGSLDIGGRSIPMSSKPFDESGLAYIDGQVYTLEEVKKLPDAGNVAGNMESNGWQKVVRARTGNWQPFLEGDSMVSSKPQPQNSSQA